MRGEGVSSGLRPPSFAFTELDAIIVVIVVVVVTGLIGVAVVVVVVVLALKLSSSLDRFPESGVEYPLMA